MSPITEAILSYMRQQSDYKCRFFPVPTNYRNGPKRTETDRNGPFPDNRNGFEGTECFHFSAKEAPMTSGREAKIQKGGKHFFVRVSGKC